MNLRTEVLDALQASVALHLSAIEVYTGQAEHLRRLGFPKLSERFDGDVKEEREHLTNLIRRIESSDNAPAWNHAQTPWPRGDIAGIFAANLSIENQAAEIERAAILTCRASGDEVSAAIFSENLDGSEASILEIETTQKVIAAIGLPNFLQAQL